MHFVFGVFMKAVVDETKLHFNMKVDIFTKEDLGEGLTN